MHFQIDPEILNYVWKIAIIGLLGWAVRLLASTGKTMLNRQRYFEIHLEAMNFALQKSFSNGYEDYRQEKLAELLEKESFIKEKKI